MQATKMILQITDNYFFKYTQCNIPEDLNLHRTLTLQTLLNYINW